MVETVKQYIENQETHHHKSSFKEEYEALLKKHGITFEERYVWG